MVNKPDLFRAAEGFEIVAGAAILSSTGPPGGDGSFQDAAALGSLYLRTDIGAVYNKIALTNSTSDWVILLTSESFSFSATNGEASSLIIGTPVVLNSGQFFNAIANNSNKIRVVGLVLDTSVSSGTTGNVQTSGIFSATTTQWDAITGGSGGLSPGPYYLSLTSGQLTNSSPISTGQYVVEIGLALSSTKLKLQIQSPISL
jgi:uncharacterized membrane protein